jgi:two-component system, chemotaxis family, protein-glutamate methylesterase/glutaminase
MPTPIKVLIIDDSASVRQALRQVLESDPAIRVIGAAQDPYVAAEIIRKEIPHVITLDIEMPRMDGLTFLEKLMAQHPIPVVVCSTLAEKGSESALAALELGAVEIITKPKIGSREYFIESSIQICDIVKSASHVRPRIRKREARITVRPKLGPEVMVPQAQSKAMIATTDKVVMVGASTGGTEALREFLEVMPMDAPGIVIVQHMPELFTARFAERLNGLCAMTVKEAADNDSVIRGQVLIAPGNKHTLLKRSGARYYVEVKDGPLVSRHRPSVDVLFRSAARYAGRNAVGVIMTGIGDDGAKGMLEMKQAGAKTIAQDERTCVVYGMPAEAVKAGAVDKSLPLDAIAAEVLRLCRD